MCWMIISLFVKTTTCWEKDHITITWQVSSTTFFSDFKILWWSVREIQYSQHCKGKRANKFYSIIKSFYFDDKNPSLVHLLPIPSIIHHITYCRSCLFDSRFSILSRTCLKKKKTTEHFFPFHKNRWIFWQHRKNRWRKKTLGDFCDFDVCVCVCGWYLLSLSIRLRRATQNREKITHEGIRFSLMHARSDLMRRSRSCDKKTNTRVRR